MNALEYAIKLDSTQAVAAMERFQITAQNVNIHMGNMGKGAGVASGGMSRWATAAGVALAASAALAAGFAALASATLAAVNGLSGAAKFEQTSIAFKTLTGSAETAKKVMEEISRMAIDTPMKEGQLQGAAKAMLAARVPAEQLKGELLAMGNIASATGGDIERLSSVYAQVAGKGKLYAEELQQFVEQGAGELRQAVAQSMGVTTAKLMDLMSEGKVGFSDLQQAIQSLAGAGGKWGEAMGEQSRTTIGLLSSLWDSVNKITRLLAQPINDGPIKAWLSTAVSVATQAAQVIEYAMANNKGGEALENALILGAKLGINALIEFVASIPGKIKGVLQKISQAIQAAFSGKFDLAKTLFGSFDMSKMQFDTTEQKDFFQGLINGAKAADQANKSIESITGKSAKSTADKPAAGADWAKQLDSKEESKAKSSAKGDDDRKKRAQDMAQNRNGIMGEIAMLQSLVTGNNAKADAIDRAVRIQKYQLEIMRQTGASEEKALELAKKKAGLEDRLNGKISRIGGVSERRMMGGETGSLSKGGSLTKGGGLAGFDRLQEKIWEPTSADQIPDGYSKKRPIPKFMDGLSNRGAIPVGPSFNRALGSNPNKTTENDRAATDPNLTMLGKIHSELTRIRTA
ncbi:tape measure protein [Prosthecobacter sp.]|jgi:tape measure domain-containing protein|uniref:tape measure protein n=1 Tax=Prosthecobacter sp. TaxID=1965333 RepID=UPI0037CB7441